MKYCSISLVLITSIALLTSCRFGQYIKMYTPVNGTEKEYRNAINSMWINHPENIVRYDDIKIFIDSCIDYPSMYNALVKRLGIDSLSHTETEKIFFVDDYMLKPNTNSWILKTSDYFMWCRLWIVNSNMIYRDPEISDICFQMIIIPNEAIKWQSDFKHKDRKTIMRRFEQDILKKISENIEMQRKNNVP